MNKSENNSDIINKAEKTHSQNYERNIGLKRESLKMQKKSLIQKKKKALSLRQIFQNDKNINININHNININTNTNARETSVKRHNKKINSLILDLKDSNINITSNKEREKEKEKDKSSALDISLLNKESSFQMDKILEKHAKNETKESSKLEQFFEFFINNNEKNKQFRLYDNTICTTKFNFFTFLPKGLLYQFSRLSNVYFLFTAIIQSIPLISPLTSITAIVPLIFVLGVSMIRELIEDLARHKYDNMNNEEEVIVMRNNEFIRAANKTLRHGEIVLVYENQGIPADMLLIDTTFKEGICYVETSSLDGEKTLKLKVANKYTQGFISRKYSKINKGLEKAIGKNNYKFEGHIKINNPNADLNYVNGTFHPMLESEDICINKDIIISNTGFLLKGSVLKNTNWIIGVVVYTGMENKIILNSKKPRLKISKIEKRLNYYLLFVFCFLMLCCIFCSVYHHFQYKNNLNYYNNFIFIEKSSNTESFIVFFTYFLLLNTFIPISLVVSTEIIKMIQGIIISWDVLLYSKFRHTYCKIKTVSIIEELGNINFIFSDKTGTLTKNQLQFRYCIIDDKYYEYEKLGKRKKTPNNNITRKNKKQNTIEIFTMQNIGKFSESYKNLNLFLNKNKHASDENVVKKNRDKFIVNQDSSSKNSNNKNKEKEREVILNRQKSFFSRAKSKILSKFSSSAQNNNSSNSNRINNKYINNINNNTITVSSYTSNINKIDKKEPSSNVIILEPNEENVSYYNEIIKIGDGYFLNPKINIFLKENKEELKDNNTFNYINEFWTALTLTNECMIKYEKDEIKYMCTSPDDLELIKTAKKQGYKLIETTVDSKTVKIADKKYKYQVLKVLGFSSERKRMSIIVKNENGIRLYIKGADCEISKRLSRRSLNNENFQVISNGLIEFSKKGLRTLMVAFRKINEDDYKSWLKQLHKDEQNMKKKQKLIDRLYDIIEKNLTLLGGTAVEDKLQDNVPETIKELRAAGIKIWVLTGDKLDTAKSIGQSCNLISNEQKTFILKIRTDDEENIRNIPFQEVIKFFDEFQMFINSLVKKYNLDVRYFNNRNNNSLRSNNNYNQNEIIRELDRSQSDMSHSMSSKSSVTSYINFAVFQSLKEKKILEPFNIIIEAPILNGLFKDEERTENFLRIAYYANAVICCRVSPSQKSQIVQKMKEFDSNAVTMAIGDGGNDVSMIMEANIGIGIVGEEGMSAVQASDFAIGEFKILKRLLFYHGRNNLYRISKMILYFFYKNFVFTMTQYYFSFLCLASGQTIIDDWYITGYNLIFTALPLCIRAITDTDINPNNKMFMKNLALLYKENRDEYKVFNFRTLMLNLFKGMVISLFIYLTGFHNSMLIHGLNKNIWYLSLINYSCTLIVVSMNLLITSNFIISLLPLSIFITTFLLFGIFLIMNHYGFFLIFNSKATIKTSFSSFHFYIVIILVSFLSFIFDYTMKLFAIYFNDSLSSKLTLYNKDQKKKNSLSRNILFKYYKNQIMKGVMSNEFDNSKNYLMNNTPMNKINIINNNNRYLNFNIIPELNLDNNKNINDLPEIKKISPKLSDNLFNYNEDNNDNINNENNNSNNLNVHIKKENDNINNKFEEDEK